jgi:hypothetical protein
MATVEHLKTKVVELERRLSEAENLIRDVAQAKEVMANSKNTKSVRLQIEVGGYLKHCILDRRTFLNVKEFLNNGK